MWKRLKYWFGAIAAFLAAVLVVVTAGATTGDVTYASVHDDPAIMGAPVKQALVAAVALTANGITAGELDELECWARLPGPTWRCRAWERKATLSDAEYRDLVLANGTVSANATAASRKQYSVILSAPLVAEWDTVTQAAWSVDLAELWGFRFWRSNAGDLTEVSGTRSLLKTVSPAQFRTDHQAGLVLDPKHAAWIVE